MSPPVPVEPTPARQETRDKVVSFLQPTVQPTPVAQVKPPLPPAESITVTPVQRSPLMEVSQPTLLPAVIPHINEPETENLPAFDQLSISTGVCNVPSGEIPRLDSLLNVESSSQTYESRQSYNSSSEDSSISSDSSSDDLSSRVRHSGSTTAQKGIPFFSPSP